MLKQGEGGHQRWATNQKSMGFLNIFCIGVRLVVMIDHRKGGIVRPSINYAAKRKSPAGWPNTKRGCVCHFIVKQFIAEPNVALVIYNQDKHVDKKGLPCHDDELRIQILSLLYVGVPVENIMQWHTEIVEKQGGPCNRVDLLTHRCVRRLERKIRRSTYDLDSDDDVSTQYCTVG
ncbi:hypothetical protein J5N97_007693 [Dioscorea zingiberensis]|uniref:Uncharacterized protein n=1 Tax=Dioscorea zingiberensis TaxID=325984 RepID=A0A9D5DFU4_9LILI|nr:hypothetical protein J5N97_007693 [Dioscorea zingiberensis]